MSRATLLPVYDGVDEVYYAHTLQLSRIRESAVLPERPRCHVKATRPALCVNQIPNTGCARLCSIPHPPFTPVTLPPHPSFPFRVSTCTRARTCLMYKRQNAPGRSIPIISLWPGPIAGSRFYRIQAQHVRTERV